MWHELIKLWKSNNLLDEAWNRSYEMLGICQEMFDEGQVEHAPIDAMLPGVEPVVGAQVIHEKPQLEHIPRAEPTKLPQHQLVHQQEGPQVTHARARLGMAHLFTHGRQGFVEAVWVRSESSSR